ncbi:MULTISPECIES: homoserine dehydrogenase [Rhodococcus]|uniref:homoserine dehydrogenase n=1 Tax=Rhodococcus TaxID=1827 RepID=UPI001E309328|nr:homoserine dehydrogenase [Rhodococcus pyridinivorans]MCD2117688.1 homoserine dehydrogenase [Rhodococcus pyridinivorans]MCZ4626666.1 homoserine dehydrogenase [Rhodococcus pyridinivorans]MCZ4647769.1 homoserine dehydrogenase [Rhodococcus pyridinivorans]MDJ0482904.1 homoserine dehydrogenase [Rhodococcus pyridinivorans]MDV7254000.1 homoserine dehydrogenase [Rhodococcus pyridinivorans]
MGVAVLGHGTVGAEVARIIREDAADLEARIGAPLELRGVAVRDAARDRGLPAELVTTNAEALIRRDDVDIVVELIGGIELPRKLVRTALDAGKSVVTANKALLAAYTGELAEVAEARNVDLYFEASVAGAIPVIRPLTQSLAGDKVNRVVGIVNGTTNYILSAMDETGADYGETLAEAGRLGYAEADPTADVEGFDAASKAAILASIAFHTRVTAADVYREGISSITAADLTSARALNCTIKLLALCERVPSVDSKDRVSARVYPALVPREHPLASVNGAFNAVVVEAESSGRLMFYGQGAGGAPTASAVMGDLVMAARNRVQGGRGPRESKYAQLEIAPMSDILTRYYVNLKVADRAGVLSAVAAEFATRGVSIAAVRQEGAGDAARLVVLTHQATDRALADTVAALDKLESVIAVTSVLRLEGSAE